MDRIATASNLLIDAQPEGWRLLLNGSSDRTLLEARRGAPIRYAEIFGTRRKLPLEGQLPVESIDRVVLGWSVKDQAWHLGFVLLPPIAEERGSRWCELAHWIDPTRKEFQATATAAGEALGAQIGRPFVLIPPVAEAVPMPPLPFHFDLWTFQQSAEGQYEFVRASKWARSNLLRAAWYLLWMVAFLVLAVTSVTSGIAYPRPELLVPAGFVCAVVLLGMAVGLVVRTLLRPNRIVIDKAGVRWLRGRSVTKTIPVDAVQSVYVSHVVSGAKRRKRPDGEVSADPRAVHYGELNLDLRDERFQMVLTHGTSEERVSGEGEDNALVPLNHGNRRTQLQAAGLLIADLFNLPAHYDQRRR